MSSTTRLAERIEHHRRYFEQYEKRDFDLARRFYRGEFWSLREGATSEVDKLARNLLCSKNLVYAIADSAVAGLLGPNPRVGVIPRNPAADRYAGAIGSFMDWLFTVNRVRRRSALALVDAVLCKRGIFKTTWDADEDRPRIGTVDPSHLYFDLVARDPADIRYWIEVTPLSKADMERRVEMGLYPGEALEKLRADRYPRWLVEHGRRQSADTVKNLDSWYTVYEYYDREEGVVRHYSVDGDVVLLEDGLDYVPYTLFFLNHSGVDCLGLSEVQLVLPQQQTVNDLLTHWKQCVYLQVPRTLYDSGRLSEEDLNLAVEASAGSLVGIMPSSVMSPDARLGNLFYEMPMPQAPEGVKEFIAREEADAAFISALTELARGHLAGAKTATEVAVMEAQLRTRLATREGHVHDALEDVARKGFWLASRYMEKPKAVRVSGNSDWTSVGLGELRDVDVDFEAVSYNPVRTNPSIVGETLGRLLPILLQLPPGIVDIVALVGELVKVSGVPAKVLFPEDEARKALAAAIAGAAEAAAPGPGVPTGPGGPGGAPPGVLPPATGSAVAEEPLPPQADTMRRAAGGLPM